MAEKVISIANRCPTKGFESTGAKSPWRIGVVAILLVMVIPLPTLLLDILLSLSFTLSLLILLTSLYITHPLEFSTFPSVLLLTTLFRLSLNIASTRLILLHGNEGTSAAGRGHQILRPVRRGGQLFGGVHHLHHPGDHQFCGHHQGQRPHRRSGGPVHPGCHARQADEHRRRPECRDHR